MNQFTTRCMLYPVGIPRSSVDYLYPHILIKVTEIKFTNFPNAKIQLLDLSRCGGKLPKGSKNNWSVTSRYQLGYTLAV